MLAAQDTTPGLGWAAQPGSGRSAPLAGCVYRQIREHQEKVGPYEHLVLASRSGFMTHEEATRGLKLFSKDVLPPLRTL